MRYELYADTQGVAGTIINIAAKSRAGLLSSAHYLGERACRAEPCMTGK